MKIDFVELITLTLKGLCDSFHGFLYVPVLLLSCIKGSDKSKTKDNDKEDTKIVEAIKTACIYNLIFTILILFVLYIICPLCNIILYMTISEDVVSSINTFFYEIGVIFKIPIQLHKLGHFYVFQDIAKLVHLKKKGKPQEWGSIQVRLSDIVFNGIVHIIYCVQLQGIYFLPTIWSMFVPNTRIYYSYGEWILQFVHISLTSLWTSLCLFEYKWYYLAWNLHKRLGYIEKNWPYFLGFSFFYSLITTIAVQNYLLSPLFYAILFPFYMISAYEVDPEENVGTFSIPVFQPSVAVTNSIIKLINRKKTS